MRQFVWMFATYVQVHVEARGGARVPLKLEWQVVVNQMTWVLGTEIRFS